MAQAKRKPKSARKCVVEDCHEEAVCKDLCHACYQWERYHLQRGHGISYMNKAGKRYDRLQARQRAYSGARARRGLRAVK